MGGRIYWTLPSSSHIVSADLDGNDIQAIDTGLLTLGNPRGIALDLQHKTMYWTDSALNTISRANLDGTDAEVVLHDQYFPVGIEIDPREDAIYWTVTGQGPVPVVNPGYIRRASLDGSAVVDLVAVDAAAGLWDVGVYSIPEPTSFLYLAVAGLGWAALSKKRAG